MYQSGVALSKKNAVSTLRFSQWTSEWFPVPFNQGMGPVFHLCLEQVHSTQHSWDLGGVHKGASSGDSVVLLKDINGHVGHEEHDDD